MLVGKLISQKVVDAKLDGLCSVRQSTHACRCVRNG